MWANSVRLKASSAGAVGSAAGSRRHGVGLLPDVLHVELDEHLGVLAGAEPIEHRLRCADLGRGGAGDEEG